MHHIHNGSIRVSSGNNEIDGYGSKSKYGDESRWKVIFEGPAGSYCKLQNIKTAKYLRFNPHDNGESIDINGHDDICCTFRPHFISQPNAFKLESAKYSGKYISITPKKWIISDNGMDDNSTIYFYCDKQLSQTSTHNRKYSSTEGVEMSEISRYEPQKEYKSTLRLTEISLPAGKMPVRTTCPSCNAVK